MYVPKMQKEKKDKLSKWKNEQQLPEFTMYANLSPSIPCGVQNYRSFKALFLFSLLLILSTFFLCIFSASAAYRAFSSAASRFSLMCAILAAFSAAFSSRICFSSAFVAARAASCFCRSE